MTMEWDFSVFPYFNVFQIATCLVDLSSFAFSFSSIMGTVLCMYSSLAISFHTGTETCSVNSFIFICPSTARTWTCFVNMLVCLCILVIQMCVFGTYPSITGAFILFYCVFSMTLCSFQSKSIWSFPVFYAAADNINRFLLGFYTIFQSARCQWYYAHANTSNHYWLRSYPACRLALCIRYLKKHKIRCFLCCYAPLCLFGIHFVFPLHMFRQGSHRRRLFHYADTDMIYLLSDYRFRNIQYVLGLPPPSTTQRRCEGKWFGGSPIQIWKEERWQKRDSVIKFKF